MSVTQAAVAWARRIAADDTHGYDQANRWGADYDCSSFVISAYKAAGVPLECTYTGNMRGDMLRHGFTDVTASVNLATGAGVREGDVLLNYARHTALALGGGRIVQASINERGTTTGGQPGDQTGREIYERGYYNYPWNCVLRYTGDDGAVTADTREYAPSYWYAVALPLLKPGMTHDTVNAAQTLLNAYGYHASVSGKMDEATVMAVKAYQTAHGLDADGEIGGLTWAALLGG
nr:MAG TPA: putative peptidoglycan binding domain protein [Caudoviricetes sp.]